MTIVAVYADDIVITSNNDAEIQNIKSHLDQVFSIKNLGLLHFFLGIEVSYTTEGILLSQEKFTKELLKDCGLESTKPAVTPLLVGLKLLTTGGNYLHDPSVYRRLIGKLNFLTNTRPNLSYIVQTLSQFMQAPTDRHWAALQHTLRYIYDSCGRGIILKGTDEIKLTTFSNSD